MNGTRQGQGRSAKAGLAERAGQPRYLKCCEILRVAYVFHNSGVRMARDEDEVCGCPDWPACPRQRKTEKVTGCQK